MNILEFIRKTQVLNVRQRQRIRGQTKRLPLKSESGFTLIEMIAVVIIIAVLSAIIAPGWLAFVNRQRVAKVNDAVFSAIQEAQREAKRTKLSYSVSVKQERDKVPEVAVHPASVSASSISSWKSLGEGLDIKPEQVLLCSNVDNTSNNTTSANSLTCGFNTAKTITFDYQGRLPEDDEAELMVAVGIPQSNNSTQVIDSTKRCVTVKTLIGSMQLGQGENECNPTP